MNTETKLLAADNDRDMLEYLEEAFSSQVHVCDNCGHETSTSECDSASDLRDYLAATPVPPQGDDWLSLAHQVQEVAAKYWKAAVKERGPGAVQWLHNSETGAMFVFTRGEYAEELKSFVMSIDEPQGDAQPVAYMAKRVTPTGNPRLDRPLLSLVGEDGWGPAFDCVPLYTRPDAGEVERLRAENEALRKTLPNSTVELVTLRAQLSQLDNQPSFIKALEQFEADDGIFVRLSDVLGALSASAEPGVKP